MRLFELSIDNTVFIKETSDRQFKILFEVTHDFGGFNSYMDLTLFNISQETAGRMLQRGSKISLKAGYTNNVGEIFSGVIKNSFRTKPETESTGVRVICVGGALDDQRPVINRSFGSGVSVLDLINAIANTMELTTVINDIEFSDIPPYSGGSVLVGDPMKNLTDLANTHGFSYLVQGETLVIVRNGSSRLGSVLQISQFTGMEGIPVVTEVGADVTTRLNPSARVGGQFQITSNFKTFNFSNVYFQDVPETVGTGVYTTQRLSHSGDSWGDTWSTRFTGIR